MFTTAAHIKTGDHIIGDARHPAGTLDYTVTSVEETTFENGFSMMKVGVESGPMAVPRQISYGADEKIALGGTR